MSAWLEIPAEHVTSPTNPPQCCPLTNARRRPAACKLPLQICGGWSRHDADMRSLQQSTGSSASYRFPAGWFQICHSRDVRPGQVVSMNWFDHDIVVFRSEAGEIGALDAHCPHMG